MKLLVTNDSNLETSFDTVVMTPTEFSCIYTQPYIAEQHFEIIVVDVVEKLNFQVLCHVMKDGAIVIPRIIGEITSYTISVLSEIYKEHSAELRRTFLLDRQHIGDVVQSLQDKYEWSKYY